MRNKIKQKETWKKYYEKNKDKIAAKQKERRANQTEAERLAHNKKSVEFYHNHAKEIQAKRKLDLEAYPDKKKKFQDASNRSNKKKRLENRLACLKHYSNGAMKCAVCDWTDIRALSIDHINGGGQKHLREIGGHIEDWLVKNNFPEGYQILCMNHQFIKRHENNEVKRNDL